MIQYYSVDRIEEKVAICIADDHSILSVPIDKFTFAIKEGDRLWKKDGRWIKDTDETAQKREEVRNLLEDLF